MSVVAFSPVSLSYPVADYPIRFLPGDPEPKPKDDEVECFTLVTEPQLIHCLLNREYVPVADIAYVDFLLHKGRLDLEDGEALLHVLERARRPPSL